uniref:Uncharacterized protein n=1 Tax=Aegilops tauschii subsp. strangulata TaxID=200361 RepID=A0A453DT97_AEGTS
SSSVRLPPPIFFAPAPSPAMARGVGGEAGTGRQMWCLCPQQRPLQDAVPSCCSRDTSPRRSLSPELYCSLISRQRVLNSDGSVSPGMCSTECPNQNVGIYLPACWEIAVTRKCLLPADNDTVMYWPNLVDGRRPMHSSHRHMLGVCGLTNQEQLGHDTC